VSDDDLKSGTVKLLQYRLDDGGEQVIRDPVSAARELLRGIRGIPKIIHSIILEFIDIQLLIWTEEERGKYDATHTLCEFNEETLGLEKIAPQWEMRAMPFKGSQREIGYRSPFETSLELGWR